MLNSTVLDVAVGLVFVYLALGLMCTAVNEWIAQLFELRSKTLREGIESLLHHEPEDASSFQPGDIDPLKLLVRLTAPGDRLAPALGLDPAAHPSSITVTAAELPSIREALAARLNQSLTDDRLHEKIDTAKASVAAIKIARKSLTGPARVRANAVLLRESYPEELGSLARALQAHPLIQSLSRSGKLPSYLPASAFSAALADILGARGGAESVALAIASLPQSQVRQVLSMLASKNGVNAANFERELEAWFNHSMDRVSGWYKRKTQVVTVMVAAAITIWANADTVDIARKLFQGPLIRQRIVQDAAALKPAELTPEQKASLGDLTGWKPEFIRFHRLEKGDAAPADDSFPGANLVKSPQLFLSWLWQIVPDRILGWLLTMIAVSLGAPFWFDMLNKVMNVRSSGTAPNEKGQGVAKQ